MVYTLKYKSDNRGKHTHIHARARTHARTHIKALLVTSEETGLQVNAECNKFHTSGDMTKKS